MVSTETMQYTLPSCINFDQLFSRTPNTSILNDMILDRNSEEIVNLLCDMSSDRADTIARCQCEELVGNYYEGTKCRVCGTFVTNSLFGTIRNELWLAIPNSIPAVLNPQAYRVIHGWLGNINKLPILTQLLDMGLPKEPIPGTPFIAGQGFTWFYNNFDDIVNYFQGTKKKSPMIQAFLEISGPNIWCTKLPVLSKLVQPITRHSDRIRYGDPELKSLMQSVFTLSSVLLAERMMKFTADHVERNFFQVYLGFISYSSSIIHQKLQKKPALLRKHIFGARYHMSGRSVAVPIVEPHDGDEIHLPWKLGVMMYKYHIISVLTNQYHLTVMDAYNQVSTALISYNHLIDKIMQQLIHECPYKGLPILMNRNPSLKIAAIQLLFATKIKPSLKEDPHPAVEANGGAVSDMSVSESDDEGGFSGRYREDLRDSNPESDLIRERVVRYVDDGTIEVSPMIITGCNADFDGDELNLLPILEMSEVPKFMNMYPAHQLLATQSVTVDGGIIKISNQQFVSLSGWVNDPDAA